MTGVEGSYGFYVAMIFLTEIFFVIAFLLVSSFTMEGE